MGYVSNLDLPDPPDPSSLEVVGYVLLASTVPLVLGGRIGHLILHPEWTDAELLLNWWPLWGLILAAFGLAVWLLRRFWSHS